MMMVVPNGGNMDTLTSHNNNTLKQIPFHRMSVGKLQPPVIPFMPLLLKDMTFAHEGNKTSLDGLVNFEKMHMMAQTMRTVRYCRSRHLGKSPKAMATLLHSHSLSLGIPTNYFRFQKQYWILPRRRTKTKFASTSAASGPSTTKEC